jgi:hypothetical protein
MNNLFGRLKLKASARLDEQVHEDISRALSEPSNAESAAKQPHIGRTIMKSRITKLAAAAAIVLGGIALWPGGSSRTDKWWLEPPAAWGKEISAALDVVKGVSCREQTIFVMADGSEHTSSTWDVLYFSRDSYRRDIYDGSDLREIQWYIPDGSGTLHHSIRFDLKSYFRSSDSGSFGNYDPVQRMRFYAALLDEADMLLGEQVIEGRNCVGFEIRASKYGDNPDTWTDCIWFDTQTKLPVRIEEHGRPVTDKPDWTFTNIKDDFNYNSELSPDTFTPWIPEGFISGHPDEIHKQ